MTRRRKPTVAATSDATAVDFTLLDQEFELVEVARLKHHPKNPRRGNLVTIGESIAAHGFFGACIVQRSTCYVLVGNHRLDAAREKGATVLPVLWVDVDDELALRILMAENAANDQGGYDDAGLAAVLAELADTTAGLVGVGYTDAKAAEIIAAAATPASLNDPDEAPPLPAKKHVITRDGDVWLLGPHRLVCGDSTDLDVVRLALDDRPAGLLWTDPPYGVDYEGRTKDKLKIANDNITAVALGELLVGSLGCAAEVLSPGATFYVCSPPGALETTFRRALDDVGLELRQQLVWLKDRFVLGRFDYHQQHESIMYGWQLPGEPLLPPHYDDEHQTMLYGWKGGAAHTFDGGRKQTSVWECPRPTASKLHPTMKPVALVRRAIENSSKAGALVLDLFAGSGSTLIACSDANRVASLVELDPRYADVICRRYQMHTGVVPVLAATGDPVDFLLEAA